MKAKWSGIGVVEGRGKLNGTVFSRNRGGAYARVKVTPNNPQTPAQLLRRSNLAFLSQEWNQLTEEQRLEWIGQTENYQKTDIFGDLRTPSGKNLFVRLNLTLLNAGFQINRNASEPLPVPAVVAGELALNWEEGDADLVLTIPANPNNEGTGIFVMDVTPPLPAGRFYVKNRFRQLHTAVNYDSSIPYTLNFSEEYIERFGEPPAGTKVHVRAYYIAENGQKGVPFETSAVMPADD